MMIKYENFGKNLCNFEELYSEQKKDFWILFDILKDERENFRKYVIRFYKN